MRERGVGVEGSGQHDRLRDPTRTGIVYVVPFQECANAQVREIYRRQESTCTEEIGVRCQCSIVVMHSAV